MYIKDKSQYDRTFLDGLLGYKGSIKLIDNYLITGNDTTYFPEDLTLDKETTFVANKEGNKYLLTVKRTNLTNLQYEFKLIDNDNGIIDRKSGEAILSSGFFLASEIDFETETGNDYGSYEYGDESNGCRFSARIRSGKDDQGKLRAKVKYSCDDANKKAVTLDECPVLRSE